MILLLSFSCEESSTERHNYHRDAISTKNKVRNENTVTANTTKIENDETLNNDKLIEKGIVRIGMSFGEVDKMLSAKFGEKGKYRETEAPLPNQDYFDYIIDKESGKYMCITVSPPSKKAKIINIRLLASVYEGRKGYKHFDVREVAINDL